MSVPAPLSVRLRTATRDMHITTEVGDLTFGATSPGGFDTCTVTLHRPISFTPGEVAQFGRLYVFDARSASIVWEGRLQDPGRSAGTDGETYQLAAVGGSAHLQDDTRQLIYVDTNIDHFIKLDNTTPGSVVEYLPDFNDTGVSIIVLRIPQSTAVDGSIPSRCVAAHLGIALAGLKMARVSFDWDAGQIAGSLVASLYAATQGVGVADVAWTATFNTTGGHIARVVGTDWTNGRNRPIIRFHYTTPGAGGVSNDQWWLQFSGLVVRTMIYDQFGVERTTGYTADTILASEVVADLLGRILSPTIDSSNATIAATSFGIEQLSYPDGATPGKVLEDLIGFEQAYTYHVWESNPTTDKFYFEWLPWPTTVRYEADVIDGFTSPASGATVYNRIAVRSTNRGLTRMNIRTQSVPILTAAGFDRTAFLDMGDDAASDANANRAGDQFLAEHQYPVNAGRLTVTRPIVDNDTGRMVQPWEIRPGNLIRVRGVAPYPNSLNNTGRDGVTVFKIAATSYSTSEAAATLDLDSYAPSVSRALASLVRRPFTRRR